MTKIHIRGTASTGLGYDPLMTRKSPVGGLHPAYRVYLVSFALGVAAMASFVAHAKVLGFVFVALMFAFAGITTVMLLALARRAKADLRATPRAPGKPTSPSRGQDGFREPRHEDHSNCSATAWRRTLMSAAAASMRAASSAAVTG